MILPQVCYFKGYMILLILKIEQYKLQIIVCHLFFIFSPQLIAEGFSNNNSTSINKGFCKNKHPIHSPQLSNRFMKKIAALLLCIGFLINGSAQRPITSSIRGKVVDTAGMQTLANATIIIIGLKDSIPIMNAEVKKGGRFILNGLKEGS